jgi:hypothetical protein
MTFRSIKNTNKHNTGEDINNDLKDVSCQRRKHLGDRPNSSLPIIKKSNYILKLQCLLKRDIFATKYADEKIIY